MNDALMILAGFLFVIGLYGFLKGNLDGGPWSDYLPGLRRWFRR